MKRRFLLLLTALFFFCLQDATAQKKTTSLPELDRLLEQEDYHAAEKILEERLPVLLKTGNPDTIAAYIPYLGAVANKLRGGNRDRKELPDLLAKVRAAFPYHSGIVTAYFAVADFFSREGADEHAYQLLAELKKYFTGRETRIAGSLHRIESNQGSYAMRFGNYGLASAHYRESLRLIQQVKNPDMSEVFVTNNSMGIVMWYASKLDSCLIFFDQAIAALDKLDSTSPDRSYRIALVQNNVANVYDELGRKEESISSLQKAIRNYKTFIASPGTDPRKKNALINQFQSIDNLASTYQDVGDYSRAYNLLYYSYQEKLKNFGEESPEVYKSLIQLGSQYYLQKDYARAASYLTKGLQRLKENSSQKKIWEAEAYSKLASLIAIQGNRQAAEKYYNDAAAVYKVILDDEYSSEYLQYLADVSSFYAKGQDATKAVSIANEGLRYATATQGKQSLAAFHHILNLAGVYLETGNYQQAISYSENGLTVLDQLIGKSERILDSISFEMEKPAAILIKIRARYALLKVRDEKALTELLGDAKTATSIIERKKATLAEEKDVAFLMANYRELLEFTNKLQLELYELTGKSAYLDQIISLQESAVYNRIRARLEKQKTLQFVHMPDAILKKEERLRADVQLSLQTKRNESGSIQVYLDAQERWNSYQKELRTEYPRYYAMRYAEKKEQGMKEIGRTIPAGITVLRFIFIGEKLFVLVIDHDRQSWIPLQADGLDKLVGGLADSTEQSLIAQSVPFRLYQQLWAPIEKLILGKRVMIIPDGILHYLSFDMLATQRPTSLRHWIDHSLVNRYAISYHYSLLAISSQPAQTDGISGFAAFAPGFSDKEKSSYREAKKNDTLGIDKEYLTLIPLPFSIDLSRRMQQELGGDIYLGNNSTNDAFRSRAGNHAIIQLGTHAETNNQYPEYSRLIFAKNLSNVNESNSLYLNDIYSCDMTSQLTVLTACETGKPGFFDGEGMVSLAHAFNYAGSESMLTGLWKIDEQSSTMITGFFYRNLEKGLAKDEALQQAKLQYLETAEGRMLAPKYWAGLIVMGDVSPIRLHKKRSSVLYWIPAGMLILALGWFLFRRREE